jgi:hypothetical protein
VGLFIQGCLILILPDEKKLAGSTGISLRDNKEFPFAEFACTDGIHGG